MSDPIFTEAMLKLAQADPPPMSAVEVEAWLRLNYPTAQADRLLHASLIEWLSAISLKDLFDLISIGEKRIARQEQARGAAVADPTRRERRP